MAEEVRLSRTVLDRNKFNAVVDRSFKTFVEPVPEQDPDTVQELFRLYDKLFFTIPIRGETNSHEHLVKRSSEVYSSEDKSAEIQPLLDEIAQLRQELLESSTEIVKLSAQAVQQSEV
jgi:hypothetical protein